MSSLGDRREERRREQRGLTVFLVTVIGGYALTFGAVVLALYFSE